MDISKALRQRFGGPWNTLWLILILMACLRFAGAEWKDEPLDVRFLRGTYLVLATVLLGIVTAIAKVLIARLESPLYWKSRAGETAVAGLKIGIVAGGVVVFVVGMLLVDDFLGPFQAVVDTVLEKLASRLPGG